MKNIPWNGIAMGCGTLAVLVLFRCVITAARFVYYGGVYWQKEIMDDPWFYVGMVAAAVCAAALLVLANREDKAAKEETSDDGWEE